MQAKRRLLSRSNHAHIHPPSGPRRLERIAVSGVMHRNHRPVPENISTTSAEEQRLLCTSIKNYIDQFGTPFPTGCWWCCPMRDNLAPPRDSRLRFASAARAGTCISVSVWIINPARVFTTLAPIGVVRGDAANCGMIVPNSLNGNSVQGSRDAEERELNRTPISLIMYHLNHLEMQCGEYMH